MEQHILIKYLDICKKAQQDQEYQQFYRHYKPLQEQFLRIIEKMEPSQQEIIFAYIEAGSDLHLRLMELACEQNE